MSRDILRGTNRYTYAANNPARFIDTTGAAPGDPYTTAQNAAIAAFSQYGQQSRDMHAEIGGFIYSFSKDGKTYFSYTRGVWPEDGKNIGPPLANLLGLDPNTRASHDQARAAFARKYPCKNLFGLYHTHVYFQDYTNERFSPADMKMMRASELPGFLMTVSGNVLYVNPAGPTRPVSIGTIPLSGEPRTDISPRP